MRSSDKGRRRIKLTAVIVEISEMLAALAATGAPRFAQDPATALASDGVQNAIAKGAITHIGAPAALAAGRAGQWRI